MNQRISINLASAFLACLMLVFFVACDSQTEEREKMHNQIMEVHDEVMPLMSELFEYRKQLRLQVDEISQSEDPDNDRINELNGLIKDLEAADDAMMKWMRNYSQPGEDQSHDEAMGYLKKEKEKIDEVSTLVTSSLAKAKEESDGSIEIPEEKDTPDEEDIDDEIEEDEGDEEDGDDIDQES